MSDLWERAQKALEVADHSTAVDLLTQLERQHSQQGIWSQRLADVYRRSQQTPQELAALLRAADKYALTGDVMRAIVMVKRIVDIDPDSESAEQRLSMLHPKLRSGGFGRPRIDAAPVLTPMDDDDDIPIFEMPLADMPIAEAMGIEPDQGISTIPVFSDDDLDNAFDAALEPTVEPESEALAPTNDVQVQGTFPLTPFFAALREDSFKRLVEKLTLLVYQPGEQVFAQGDEGDAFYVISEGTVEVFLQDQREVLGTLDEGEFFGEIALITDHPRTASVRARTQVVLLEVNRAAISELIYEDPEVMTILLWFLRDRLVDTLIRTNELFQTFPWEKRRKLADRFHFIESRKPVTLIEQGAQARGLIILLAGSAKVTRKIGDQTMELATLGPGEVCGEMSLLSNEPAVATVTTTHQIFALEIAVDEFKSLVAENPDLLLMVEDIAERRRADLVAKLDEELYSEGNLGLV